MQQSCYSATGDVNPNCDTARNHPESHIYGLFSKTATFPRQDTSQRNLRIGIFSHISSKYLNPSFPFSVHTISKIYHAQVEKSGQTEEASLERLMKYAWDKSQLFFQSCMRLRAVRGHSTFATSYISGANRNVKSCGNCLWNGSAVTKTIVVTFWGHMGTDTWERSSLHSSCPLVW